MTSIMPCGCTWLCSARRLQIPDDDIWHAYENAIALVEIGEDPQRYLVAGCDGDREQRACAPCHGIAM